MNKILETRIRGVNKANYYANQLAPKLAEIFAPLVGKKIEKQDGTLLAKYAALVPDFSNAPVHQVYRHRSDYSLAWTVKTCEVVDGHAYYHEATVYVGNMRNGVLESLIPVPTFKADYKAEDIEQNRAAFNAAKKAYDEAQSALFPFGEYDR